MTNHPHLIDPPEPIRVPAGGDRWDEYWAVIGNEDWLAARRLMDLSPRVRGFFATYLLEQSWPASDEDDTAADAASWLVLDWCGAAGNVRGEGFSSTQRRLAELVLALVNETPIVLSDLVWLNEWTVPVWTALLEWATHGASTVKASW